MTRFTLLTIALISTAGLAQAQPANTPLDPNGRPFISSGPQPSPGDPGTAAAPRTAPSQNQAMMGDQRSQQALKDEYGFRYNERGDRIDAQGRIMPPPETPPGTPALR